MGGVLEGGRGGYPAHRRGIRKAIVGASSHEGGSP